MKKSLFDSHQNRYQYYTSEYLNKINNRIFIVGDVGYSHPKNQRVISYDEINDQCKEKNFTYIEVDSATGLNFTTFAD